MKIDREKIYDKFGGRCGYCGTIIDIKNMQVDHIISQRNFDFHIKNRHFHTPSFLKHLKEWDVHHFDNLMPSCRKCNNYKSSMSLETFKEEIKKQIERLEASVNFWLAKRFWLVKETGAEVIFYFEKLQKLYE